MTWFVLLFVFIGLILPVIQQDHQREMEENEKRALEDRIARSAANAEESAPASVPAQASAPVPVPVPTRAYAPQPPVSSEDTDSTAIEDEIYGSQLYGLGEEEFSYDDLY